MAILLHDCPRCGGNNLGFTYVAETVIQAATQIVHAMFICPKCKGPILVRFENPMGYKISNYSGDLHDLNPLEIEWIEPPARSPMAPSHTPTAVADFYIEACDNLYRSRWTSAAGMLRKCLEVSLKEFAPEVEAWKLEKRIDKLAAENLITPALRDWAHELRLDGNEALHGTEPATEELATRMERLTYFLLTYLYALPAQVEAAREARKNGN